MAFGIQKVFLAQIILNCTLGLILLFWVGLPAATEDTLISILPLVFPMIFTAVFLFLLPLFDIGKGWLFWSVVMLVFIYGVMALLMSWNPPVHQDFQKSWLGYLMTGLLNVFLGGYYVVAFLKKK